MPCSLPTGVNWSCASEPLRPSCHPDAHVGNDYARLPRGHVCIDTQPYTPTLVPDPSDTLNIGGFSDSVFNAVAMFNPVALFNVVAAVLAEDTGRFVADVEAVEL